jgi:aryl-alcohol dehydrogenase-like predicted oxidoreductase
VLGEVLKKNSKLTVTTKVGLYSFYGLNPSHSKILAIRIFQKLTRKLFPNYSKPFINFNLKQAKKSLENSLKNLQRDCIDIYTLHEPCEKLINSDEWKIFLEDLVKEGKIRYYGLALEAKNLKTFIENNHNQLFNILQVQDSTIHKEADILTQNNLPFQITYGYFSTALKNNKNMNYLNCLKEVLTRNKTGSVIISSNNFKHILEISKNANSILIEKK